MKTLSDMIPVTCAIIRNEEGDILVVQRGEASDHPYKWEFPGGKVAPGESEEDCIIREIDEELSMEIVICEKLVPVEHDYGFKQIRLIPFVCDTLDEKPVLHEHIDGKWVKPGELSGVDLSEADIEVAEIYVSRYRNVAGQGSETTVKLPEIIDSAAGDDLRSFVNSMMSQKEAEWVAASAAENNSVFTKLLEYSLSGNRKLAFRASWTLGKVCDKYPELLNPYLDHFVEVLDKTDNESALRSFLRILSLSDIENINPGFHGQLADFCFNILNSGKSAIAVKAYSMELLYKLSVIYPEIGGELASSIMVLMEDGTAGITSRGRSVLKKLADNPLNRGSNRK